VRRQHFGDSYDLVKQSFLGWLSALGAWTIHPMFTAPSCEWAQEFSKLVGCRLLSTEVLRPETNRSEYFATSHRFGHLFLDPDTGLSKKHIPLRKRPAYLMWQELILIGKAKERRHCLTLVFDQSVARGQERPQVELKLRLLRSEGLFGLAYVSQACFILVSQDRHLVSCAHKLIVNQSRLPADRLIFV